MFREPLDAARPIELGDPAPFSNAVWEAAQVPIIQRIRSTGYVTGSSRGRM
jgi:hypothetical protein